MEGSKRFLSTRTWVVLFLNGFLFLLGCGPQNLTMFLLPFTDDKVPPNYKLAGEKETTVAVYCTFAANDDRPPEVLPADTELADRLQQQLQQRCHANKEKVKLIPTTQVRSAINKLSRHKQVSPLEVGKVTKADKVIVVEINAMTLFEYRSKHLYRGHADLMVSVYDMHQEEDMKKVFDHPYSSEYPRNIPIEANGGDVAQFRALFLNKISEDLARLFVSYDPDEKRRLD